MPAIIRLTIKKMQTNNPNRTPVQYRQKQLHQFLANQPRIANCIEIGAFVSELSGHRLTDRHTKAYNTHLFLNK